MIDWFFLAFAVLAIVVLLAKSGLRGISQESGTYILAYIAVSSVQDILGIVNDTALGAAAFAVQVALLAYSLYLALRTKRSPPSGAA